MHGELGIVRSSMGDNPCDTFRIVTIESIGVRRDFLIVCITIPRPNRELTGVSWDLVYIDRHYTAVPAPMYRMQPPAVSIRSTRF